VTRRKLRVHARVFCVAAALMAGGAASVSASALADEITVMIAGGFASAYRDLGLQFEEATGETLITLWGPAMGSAVNAIPARLARGESADVLIMAGYALDDQINAGKVLAGSKVDLARSPIGVAVREGAPKPDIGSLDALRQTLAEAKSIVYPDDASGVYIRSELFQRLGIEGQVESKSRMVPAERVARVVADGEAELGLQQVVELLPAKGITVVGSLPDEVQRYTVYSGGIATNAKNPAGADALIRFLSSPDAAAAIMKTGLEPLLPPKPAQ
jgi:molybdate transport system substrate-binding protein